MRPLTSPPATQPCLQAGSGLETKTPVTGPAGISARGRWDTDDRIIPDRSGRGIIGTSTPTPSSGDWGNQGVLVRKVASKIIIVTRVNPGKFFESAISTTLVCRVNLKSAWQSAKSTARSPSSAILPFGTIIVVAIR